MSRYRSPSGRYFDWAQLIADAKKKPGKFILLSNETVLLVKIITQRRHRELQRMTGGVLEVERFNVHRDANHTKRADLYVRFVAYDS